MAEPSTSSSTTIKLYCPIEQTWTITEKELRENAGSNTDSKSEAKEVSAIPKIQYYLSVPSISRRGEISIILCLSDAEEYTIHGKYSFNIKSANYFSQHVTVFDEDVSNWGDVICAADKFFDSKRKFIVDGNFTVQMKGVLIIDVNEIPKVIQMEPSPLVQQLWKNDDKDFKIVVGNEGTIMIHKCVLAARSNSFEAMLLSGREETQTNTLKIIDFHLRTVQLAVEFFYDRNIFDTMILDDAFELLRFADKYVIDDLEDKLITHISYRISPSTVCGLVNRAIALNSIKLRQFCFDFMMIFLRHAIRVDDLNILDKEFAAESFQKALSSSFD